MTPACSYDDKWTHKVNPNVIAPRATVDKWVHLGLL
jgi:hypothetical protein